MAKRRADFVDPDELFTDEDQGHEHLPKSKSKSKKSSGDKAEKKKHRAAEDADNQGGRTRPTNNQLLYKAFFRWPHYPTYLRDAGLPSETDACASVTSAFLQVLQTLHTAEHMRSSGTAHPRSVLQILSTNTRRTKVVELSSGTHRVPDELKKHYLSDGEGGQYSTNLDRNRYGNDDNYLFTVIRYDLEFLGLCPCLVDVEIIDAKAGNQSVIVSAGPQACTCQHKPDAVNYGPLAALPIAAAAQPAAVPTLAFAAIPAAHAQTLQAVHPQGLTAAALAPPHAPLHPIPGKTLPIAALQAIAAPQAAAPAAAAPPSPAAANGAGDGPSSARTARTTAAAPATSRDSPKPSTSGVSQLFDTLVMAAIGSHEGPTGAAEVLVADPPAVPSFLNVLPGTSIGQIGDEGAGGPGAKPMRGPQLHHAPMRNKSRLWSAMSFGDMDSLQNALDAFRAEEEIASQPVSVKPEDSVGNGAPVTEGVLRQRRRKPPRGNSSFLLRAGDSMMGANDFSLSKLGLKFETEKSGDNQEVNAGGKGEVAGGEGSQEGEDRAEGGGGTTGDGTTEDGHEDTPERPRGRVVPRQASAVNLSHRTNTAELSRLRVEIEQLKNENQRLRDNNSRSAPATNNNTRDNTNAKNAEGDDKDSVGSLRAQLKAAQSEAAQHLSARQAAEERLTLMNLEISKLRHENQVLISKLVPNHQGVINAQIAQLAAVAAGGAGASGIVMTPMDGAHALAGLAAYPQGWTTIPY